MVVMFTRRDLGLYCFATSAWLLSLRGIATAQDTLDPTAARRNRRMMAEREFGGGPVPIPVAPEVGGLFTRFEQPTVFFFLKSALAGDIQLTVQRDGDPRPVFAGSLGTNWAKGLHAIHFSDLSIRLLPTAKFEWTLGLRRVAHEPVQVSATIVWRRISPSLNERLAHLSPDQAVDLLQQGDYWYDAFLVAMQAPTGERETLTRTLLTSIHIDMS
jgi:hypothetical protein